MGGDLIWHCRPLVPGEARGTVVKLSEPLSFWGGLDPKTGAVVDMRHPDFGRRVDGAILVLPSGKGSSSASSILLEAVRLGTEPAAILTAWPDEILALGAVVARELYGRAPAFAVLGEEGFERVVDGQRVALALDGRLTSLAEEISHTSTHRC